MKGVVNQIITEGRGEKAVSKAVIFEQEYLIEYKEKGYVAKRRFCQGLSVVGFIGILVDMFLFDFGNRVIPAVLIGMVILGLILMSTSWVQPKVTKEWTDMLPHPYLYVIKSGELVKDDIVELEVIVRK